MDKKKLKKFIAAEENYLNFQFDEDATFNNIPLPFAKRKKKN